MKNLIYAAILAIAFTSCKKKDDDDNNGNNDLGRVDIVYLQTNDQGGNAILAYKHIEDSTTVQIQGSPFSTGGTGVANPTQKLGPDDSDQEVVLTSDNKFLLAVNGGSNTIAVFNVGMDGSLSPVAGSPFPSGGDTPSSIYVSGTKVYVVNKSDNPLAPTTVAPNYVTFDMSSTGALTMVANSKFETTIGTSPSASLLSRDKKFLFGCDFLGFMLPAPVGTLRSFTVDAMGIPTPVAGTPLTIPAMGGALGLAQHPSSNTLYVGFPVAGMVGVYTINSTTGELTFTTSVPAGPAACWLRTNTSGSRLYCLNSGVSTISVYNTSSPASPVSFDTLALKQPGPLYTIMGMTFTTSEPFALAVTSDNDYLYVVSQHTNPDFTIGNWNYLHVVDIDSDGRLTENADAIQIPVANTVRPKGVAVMKLN